jgi:hypothetical protein
MAFGTRRSRVWTPHAIPFGLLIMLLGLWAFFAPLVGGYVNLGFASDATWQFSSRQWELQLVPGLAAAAGGFMLMTPARGWGNLGVLLAFLAAAWLIVGPSFAPVFDGDPRPYGSEFMRAIRWIAHFYGPGGLILFLAGYARGLFQRRTIVERAPPVPVEETRVTVPE